MHGEEEGGAEMKLPGGRRVRRKTGEVRKRKVGARLSPSNPSSLESEVPSVASCCGAERR